MLPIVTWTIAIIAFAVLYYAGLLQLHARDFNLLLGLLFGTLVVVLIVFKVVYKHLHVNNDKRS